MMIDNQAKILDDNKHMTNDTNKLVPISALYDRLAREGISTRSNAAMWWQYQIRKGRIPQIFPKWTKKRIPEYWIDEIVTAFRPGGDYAWKPDYMREEEVKET